MSTPLRLGTRRSALARAQSQQTADAVTALTGRDVVLVDISTEGDRSRVPLTQLGGTGVFVTALREALLDGRVDLAVHSLKDLPTAAAPGIALAAVPRRADPRDVLVAAHAHTLGSIPAGATVGTGSPRRASQLSAARPDVSVVDMRGNVDTRLRRVADGSLDAVVLALAGLQRLGRADEATDVLDPEVMLPAPGQGALAVECRAGDDDLADALAGLDDAPTRDAVTAERALLAALEAGCSAPVGALATVAGDVLHLRAAVGADGGGVLRVGAEGPTADAAALGRRLADDVLRTRQGSVGSEGSEGLWGVRVQ